MNKKIFTLIALIVIVFAVALLMNQQSSSPASTDSAEQSKSDARNFHDEYSLVEADNRFAYATGQQVLEIFESGSGVVFLGFKECPWCQQLAPRVDQAAKAESLEKIHYLDIRAARQDNDATYQKLVDVLRPYLEKDQAGQPRIYVPDVSFVKDGQIVGRYEQESSIGDEPVTPDTFWNEERSQRAVTQLRELIQKVQ